MADEHDDDRGDDEENQYGGSNQDVDAVEQTERITDGEEPGGDGDGGDGGDGDDGDGEDQGAEESSTGEGSDRDGADEQDG